LANSSFDAVISQEALLHVPDKGLALREAFRILRRGGRIAFTDLVCHAKLNNADAALMWEGMAIQTLQDIEGYRVDGQSSASTRD
jgi:ubiquinone/menaquinone biosynthesis C-methylase UbiE